jgi:asparagine synthase (glutamine-hydrolysing)
MCGICGQYNYQDTRPVVRETIQRMTDTMIHRGPDDEGYFIQGPIGLGFRRLSIIDLEGGHQPMADREESVWVVFNGEIYNFPELKRELEGKGHRFRTLSDTEVILHGYKEWGREVFEHLNGMFGIGLWDVRERRLILARDAMGIKPIYYHFENGSLYFGSEIKSILKARREKTGIDPLATNLFLRYRYTPAPYTIFQGIQKLAPGTLMIVENGKSRIERWYGYRPSPFPPSKPKAEAREELLDIYQRAVKRHLLSDVPVGLLLSGGLDSGLLLGLMNREGQDWSTFTVGFGSDFKDDELLDAEETAGIFHSKHYSIQLTRETFEQNLPRVMAYLEEPVAASSIVPMYSVCQLARRQVKVALMGQGPDELFGGYRRHLGVRYGGLWRQAPPWIRTFLGRGIRKLPRNETLKRGLFSLDLEDRYRRYQNVLSLVPDDRIDALFREELLLPGSGDRVLECWADLFPLMENIDELGGFQFLEVRSTLPDELLMYADKLSMANSLEVRVPFLDREVVEYVEKLGSSFKVRYGSGKWLHREVCRRFLPPRLLKRKKKGFAVNVVDDWFQSSLKGRMVENLLDDQSLLFEMLKPEAVRTLLKEHQSGKEDNHKLLFSLSILEQCLQTFFAGSS